MAYESDFAAKLALMVVDAEAEVDDEVEEFSEDVAKLAIVAQEMQIVGMCRVVGGVSVEGVSLCVHGRVCACVWH